MGMEHFEEKMKSDLPGIAEHFGDFAKWRAQDSERESMELPSLEEPVRGEHSQLLNSMIDRAKEMYAPAMEVQAEKIKEIYQTMPELQFGEWRNLSAEERVKILGAFEEKIADIEKRNFIPVCHEPMEPGHMGYHDGQKLVISDQLICSNEYADYKTTLNTLFHEGRHAYQNHNLYICRTETSDETYDSWVVNRKKMGYSSGDTSFPFNLFSYFKEKCFNKYYTQPVEVDARLFAEAVEKKLGI